MAARVDKTIMIALGPVFEPSGFTLTRDVLGGGNGSFATGIHKRLSYIRKCGGFSQKFWCEGYRHPADDARVLRFAADYAFEATSLDDFANGVMIRCGLPEMKGKFGCGYFRGSIGYLGPERNYKYWSGEPDYVAEIADSLADYCHLWVLPFYDEYQSLSSLLEGVGAEDDRLWVGSSPQWAVTVAIAYDFLGNVERASTFLRAMADRYSMLALRYKPILQFYGSEQPGID